MAQLVTSSTYPSPSTPSMAAADLEFAPGSVPLDAPSYTTITGRIRKASVRRGRSAELDRFTAGKLAATAANRDRLLDLSYSSSPWAAGLRAERMVRMMARYAGVTYPVAVGYLDGLPQTFTGHGKDTVVELAGTDLFKVLALADIPESMLEFAIALDTIQPSHWWKCNDNTSSVTAIDSGSSATTIAALGNGATFGATGVVPYDGSNTAVTTTGETAAMTATGAAPQSGSWTMEMWYSWATPTSFGGPSLPLVTATQDGWFNATSAKPYMILFISGAVPAGTIDARIITTTGVPLFVNNATIVSPTRADTGVHQVVITWSDTTRTLTAYVDSVLQGTATAASGSCAFPTNTRLEFGGTQSNVNGFVFPRPACTFQHMLVYDGAVLTAAQIANHYTAGATAFSGNATGTQIGRVLDYCGVPSTLRSVATGNATIGAYELPGGKALDYLQRLAETEAGQLYVDRSGVLTFRNRQAPYTDSRSTTSQATFGDGGGGELAYVDLELEPNDETVIRNDVTIGRNGGSPQRVYDAESIRQNLRQTFSATDRMYATDNDAFDIANWILDRYKDPHYRIAGITINPLADPANLWPQVLGREIGDRITVNVRPMGIGSVNSQELIIEGIEHDIGPGTWLTKFRLSQADTRRYWILGDATYGVLGSTTRLFA